MRIFPRSFLFSTHRFSVNKITLNLSGSGESRNFVSEGLFLLFIFCYLIAVVTAKVAVMSKVNLIRLLLILYKHKPVN